MTGEIKPYAVDYEDVTEYRYPAPRLLDKGTGTGYTEHLRSWTIGELEDVLAHAQMHGADEGTLVLHEWAASAAPNYVIRLPKSPEDIGQRFPQRIDRHQNQYWHGFGVAIGWCVAIAILLVTIYGNTIGLAG